MPETIVIGRRDAGKYPAAQQVNIGRPSKFGNPYPLGSVALDGHRRTRPEVLGLFGECWARWVQVPAYREAALALRGKILVCPGNCKPLPCHGDIIVEWLEQQEGGPTTEDTEDTEEAT